MKRVWRGRGAAGPEYRVFLWKQSLAVEFADDPSSAKNQIPLVRQVQIRYARRVSGKDATTAEDQGQESSSFGSPEYLRFPFVDLPQA